MKTNLLDGVAVDRCVLAILTAAANRTDDWESEICYGMLHAAGLANIASGLFNRELDSEIAVLLAGFRPFTDKVVPVDVKKFLEQFGR